MQCCISSRIAERCSEFQTRSMDTQICAAVPESEAPAEPDSNVPRSRPAANASLQMTVQRSGQELGLSIKQVSDQLPAIIRLPQCLYGRNSRYPVSYRWACEYAKTAKAEPRFSFLL